MPRESSTEAAAGATYRAGPVSVVKEAFKKLICQKAFCGRAAKDSTFAVLYTLTKLGIMLHWND